MIDASSLSTALYSQLSTNAAIIAASCEVERSTRVNFDPARTPWLGVYPGDIDSVPRAMGGNQWVETAELQVVVQTASYSSDGTAASDALEGVVKAVLDAVIANLTLGLAGVRVVSTSREYSYVMLDSDGSGDLFMPQAVIKFKLEVRS